MQAALQKRWDQTGGRLREPLTNQTWGQVCDLPVAHPAVCGIPPSAGGVTRPSLIRPLREIALSLMAGVTCGSAEVCIQGQEWPSGWG